MTPYDAVLGATQTQQFVAAMSDSSSAGFVWSLADCTQDCGTITTDGLYTAPAFVSKQTYVTIRATSQADANMFGSGFVNLQPVSVRIAPAALSRLAPGTSRSFAVEVKYDPANQGVTWSLSGAGCTGSSCGTLSDATATSVSYRTPDVVPNPPAVMLQATSVTDGNRVGVVGLIVTASSSPFTLQGSYAFLIQGKRAPDVAYDYANGGDMAIAGHINIDGSGGITGVWDATLKSSGGMTEPISGSYAVAADGTGTLTLQASSGTWKFGISIQPGGESAALWQDAANAPPISTISVQSGYLLRQDPSAFSMSSVAGDRVLALTFMNVGALGRFTSDSAGTLSNAQMDLTWSGGFLHFFTTSTLTGFFTPPDPATGRGTAALTVNPGPDAAVETFHLTYYIVSTNKMLLAQSDANNWQFPVLRGEARYQNGAGAFTNASWNVPVIYNLNSDDAGSWFTPFATLGVIRPDGAGSLTETFDNTFQVEDVPGSVLTLAASSSGTYSLSANGRVELSLPGVTQNLYKPNVGVAYLTEANSGYLIREQIFGTPFGYFEPQAISSFSTSTLAGTFTASLAGPPRTFKAEREAGFITLQSDGSASAFLSVDRGNGMETFNATGDYTVSQDGRGVVNLTEAVSGKQRTIVFWAVSPNRFLAILSMTADDVFPALVELRR